MTDSITGPENVRTYEVEIGGRTLSLETGRVAGQAAGAVLVRYGDTVVLVTASASEEPREGVDFFPLTVDYEERHYAVGKIPGSFFRREGRPTEKAILSARLTDRPIRPLFPDGFRNDVQVIVTVMSVDFDNAPEICGLVGASAALTISDIPWGGPIGAVVVGLVDGEFVINPTREQEAKSQMHLTVAGTRDAVLMVEAGANQVPEETMLDAIFFGHRELQKLISLQERMREEIGKPKREIPLHQVDPELEQAVRAWTGDRMHSAIMNADKLAREADVKAILDEAIAEFAPDDEERAKDVAEIIGKIEREEVRSGIITRGVRPDGRGLTDIRPIWIQVGVLPRVHGSGLFTRGQTQALTVATLGTVSDLQVLDNLTDEEYKRYIHHYNFPPYSTGEARPLRGPGRREIGHGALAERALEPVIPSEEEFPYTIRLVSEILSSNGSTSMASVCGSTLALMDAGVPIKAPVAGIAMGLIKEGDHVAVLTDIQGVEDHLGDMDFKVAGTATGVTALQMDIKIAGVTRDVLEQALRQAREARLFILQKMLEVIPAPRPELSPYAPRIITLTIDPDKIRDVIGPGGKTINKIILETGAKIDIEDDGKVYVAAADREAGEKAVAMIRELTREVVAGEVYKGRVTRIMNFGAFVEVLPGKEGLVHISELSPRRVERVEDVVNIGDELDVVVTEIDRMGRINLSHKALLPPERQTEKRQDGRHEGAYGGKPHPRHGDRGGRGR